MPFSMPYWSRPNLLVVCLALLLAGLLPFQARADSAVRLNSAELVQKGEMWHVEGNFEIRLSNTLEEALRRGVQLTFVQEFESQRPRDWWLAQDVAELSRILRLSYNALLKQYYVTVSGHSTTLETLDEALRTVGDLSDWAVLNQSQLRKKQPYTAAVRMYLDVTQLPKPLQLNAFASTRWQLDSGWQEWTFKP